MSTKRALSRSCKSYTTRLPITCPHQCPQANQPLQSLPSYVYHLSLCAIWLTSFQFSRLFSSSTESTNTPANSPMPQGLYLYGDVGTGKTMLMDLFYNTLPPSIKRKRRVHFHAFMVDVHKRVHAAKHELGLEGGDPIAPVARDLAKEAYVLCFDEFQVRT